LYNQVENYISYIIHILYYTNNIVNTHTLTSYNYSKSSTWCLKSPPQKFTFTVDSHIRSSCRDNSPMAQTKIASYQNEWKYLNDDKPNQEAVIDGSWRRLFVWSRDDLSHLSVLSFPSAGEEIAANLVVLLARENSIKNTSKQATKSCKITYEVKWESARI